MASRKISKCQLQTPPYPDLIRVIQRHPLASPIRQVFRAAIEKILHDPTHLQYGDVQKRIREVPVKRCAMSNRRTLNGALLGISEAAPTWADRAMVTTVAEAQNRSVLANILGN